MNRAVLLRIAACGLLGLGSGLLIAALLLSTYTSSRIQQIPLNLDARLVSSGTGTVLDPQSLSTPHFRTTENTPVEAVRAITVEQPSGPTKVTLQVGDLVRRTDKQEDQGLLLALVDTVSLDRATALPIPDSGFLQRPRTIEHPEPAVPKPLPHEGLTYRFPFDTEKKTYPFFDPIAQKAFDANYEGEDDVNGLTAYKFVQNVGYDADGKLVEPIKYASLYKDAEDAQVTARASQWGLPGDPDEPIAMTRFYAAKRTFWVDPVSGTIVKAEERQNHYYARDPLRPEATMADYTVTSTEATVESQVAAARDERDRIALWSRILPITFTAAGLVALVAGVLLGSFGIRAESALAGSETDSDGGGFFAGRRDTDTGPMPAAEAETEKLPTQRPDLQSDQGSS